ncbi:hypothetical protein, partial [Pseudomonas syringae]|uniref:hypothetical protein n=1 Tax=Pseudomonas syringae TaxID=317 RepID=UPI001FFA320C
ETDLPDRAGKTRACLTAGPNQPEHKKTDTPAYIGFAAGSRQIANKFAPTPSGQKLGLMSDPAFA